MEAQQLAHFNEKNDKIENERANNQRMSENKNEREIVKE